MFLMAFIKGVVTREGFKMLKADTCHTCHRFKGLCLDVDKWGVEGGQDREISNDLYGQYIISIPLITFVQLETSPSDLIVFYASAVFITYIAKFLRHCVSVQDYQDLCQHSSLDCPAGKGESSRWFFMHSIQCWAWGGGTVTHISDHIISNAVWDNARQ